MGKNSRKLSKAERHIKLLSVLDPETLSQQIRRFMTAQGMRVDQVAKRAEMTGERLAELMEEKLGGAYPTLDEIQRLARALNTKPTSLVYRRG